MYKPKILISIIVFILTLGCNNSHRKEEGSNNEVGGLNLYDWCIELNHIKSIDQNHSKSFNLNLSDSTVIKDKIKFYRFKSDNYSDYKLFLGARNDTIFCYDSEIDFYDTFLILNKNKKMYLSWIGTDYRCELVSSEKLGKESFYFFKMHIDEGVEYDDVIKIMDDYPNIVFKEFYISDLYGFKEIKFLDRKTNEIFLLAK